MRRGFPLYGRILLWLLLNILLVCLLLAWVLKSFYGVGVNTLAEDTVERRVVEMTELLIPALENSSKEGWGGLLEKFGENEGVELALFNPNGNRKWAGSDRAVPEDLTELLAKKFPPPRNKRRSVIDDLLDEPRGPRRGPRRDGPPRDDNPRNERGPQMRKPHKPGEVEMVVSGKFGSSKDEIAVTHLWIEANKDRPNDMVLVAWKTDEVSKVFFSWRPLIYTLIGLLLLTGLLWLPFVFRVTRRLRILTEGAESVSDGEFAIQVASERRDELGRLSRALQSMAGKLNDYVSGQKRFLGDIAHELCSPLVRVRMGLGVLEHSLNENEHEKLASVQKDVEALSQLVNELLDFSKASIKPEQLKFDDVDLVDTCEEVIDVEAGDHGDEIRVEFDGRVTIVSHKDLLKRAVSNVVRNAIRYAGSDGAIIIRLEKTAASAFIHVEDQGPGLPAEWKNKVFEPFSRPERARTREGGGSGLGLAIARTCVESLGGKISCKNRSVGGLRVSMEFPHIQERAVIE